MKKILSLALASLVAFSPVAAHAVAVSNQVTASASVSSSLSLEMAIVEHDAGVDSQVANMAFGSLTPTGFGGLASTKFFTVYLTAHTQTVPYIISQNGGSLTNAALQTIPTGAQNMVIVYNSADNGGTQQNPVNIPTGAFLGVNGAQLDGTWVGARQIYDSENANAQERTIQAIYGLRSDAALGAGNFVPANQPGGNYTANITFTVTV